MGWRRILGTVLMRIMKTIAGFQWSRAAWAAAVLVVMVGCAAPVQRRIERNPELFAKLSTEDQGLVRQGRLREGMTKEAVFLAFGRPDRVATGRKGGKDFEKWTYLGQRAVTTQTFGMGFGAWGGGWGGGYCGPYYDPFLMGGPVTTYIPYDAASVDFAAGRVTGWESSPGR